MNSKGQYPTQPTYPVQPPGNLAYPQTLHLPQAPPGYSELSHPSFVHPEAATVPTVSAAFAGTSPYLLMAQSVAVGPLGSTIPVAYYPVGPIYPLVQQCWWKAGMLRVPDLELGLLLAAFLLHLDALPVLLSWQSCREPMSS
ncbi:DAZ-associated protein 2 [Sciurus carolinensis]|uniref:DAZ-associated protein 2 n=1 Tax=Sciurus carolinensis TaxID=30640 RepID=A0AA41NAW2_SCICA|nr:DAZ-associated protein 2 [Sciurus carolinensis]